MKPPDRYPPHRYVPGRTPRHDDAIFEALHDSVQPGMTPDQLCRTDAWAAGWHYLDQGYYWEAHEVLEPVWMETDTGSVERHLVQCLIQVANAALKVRMDRPNAVVRLCDIAADHLREAGANGHEAVMGVRLAELARRIAEVRAEVNLE